MTRGCPMYETREERDALFRFTGKYTEVKLLNEKATGFGWAVLVKDNYEGNRLKVVKLPNQEATTRELLVEAEILSKIAEFLRHPNLIALGSVDRYIIDWNGRKEDRWFIVLQYGGDNLRRRLGRIGLRSRPGQEDEYVYRDGVALTVDEVLHIATQAADGLRALHDFEERPGEHIIHRDIKPENILIDADGVVRITDFGISKVVERLTQSITVAGTPPYLAPEYSRGRLTAASDIYSLGIVLYEMATGRFPFDTFEQRFYRMPEPPHRHNPGLPAALSDVIMRCLWWDPNAGYRNEDAQRYRRAAELHQDLQRCYRRLHPVPPQYEPFRDRDPSLNLYRDRESSRDVRIFLYATGRPAACLSRLAAVRSLDERRVLSPIDLFEPEGMVGVVVPVVPSILPPTTPVADFPLAATVLPSEPPPSARGGRVEGKAVYDFLPRLVTLCRQLERLHRHGVYHGLLVPDCLHWDGDGWIIDRVWLGALAGLTAAEEVFRGLGDEVGYVAPEMLRWDAPPALAADIYGIGAVLYGWLTGTPPMDASAARAISEGQPPPPFRAGTAIGTLAPTVSRRLQRVLVKALQTEPAQRQRSLDELERELSACRWPDDMVATYLEDAREYCRQGRAADAYDVLDAAQRLDPGSPDIHHARAEVFFMEGEYKWALKENQKALNVETTVPACLLHARCLLALERCDEATEVARTALEQEDSSRVRHLLAQCLEKGGEPRGALREYESARRIAEVVEKDPVRLAEIVADLTSLRAKLGA